MRPFYRRTFFLAAMIGFLGLPLFAETAQAAGDVFVVPLSGQTINPVTAEYLIQTLNDAEASGALAVLIELDTPGGLLDSTRQIVKRILTAKIPVIVYISPQGSRAGSAGVFITYAGHIAAMAPSTNIGAAHPVSVGGDQKDRTLQDAIRDILDALRKDKSGNAEGGDASHSPMEDKILNDTVAFIQSIARERGRNEAWAKASVTESASITAEEALELGVVEFLARDRSDLLRQLHGHRVSIDDREIILDTSGVVLEVRKMTTRQKILDILANPNLSYILLMLGFYGLLFEVTHPGIGVPGVLGTIFLIVALFSMQLLPVNYAGLGLILLGIILFVAEVFVPGFGLPTLGGLIALVLGSLFLFDSDQEAMRISFSLILSFSLSTALITIVLVRAVIRTHRAKVVTGKEGLIGSSGEIQNPAKAGEKGKVYLNGELWTCVCSEDVSRGDGVRVKDIKGMILQVEKAGK